MSKRVVIAVLWLLLTVLLAWGIIYYDHLPDGEKGKAEWLRGIGFFLAGIGVAPLGLWLAHHRTMSLSGQTENESARRITDAFTKAVELLGHESIAVRQGGIYALGRIAHENRKEHSKIMDIVAAYIRDRSVQHIEQEIAKHLKPLKDVEQTWDEEGVPPWIVERDMKREHIIGWITSRMPMPIDLEAAVAVLRDRNKEFDKMPVGFRLVDFRREDMATAKIKYAPESVGGRFDLSNSFLFNADFNHAHLGGVNFSDSRIHGCVFAQARMPMANLVNTNLVESDFVQADLRYAMMRGANLTRAKLHKADIRHTDLSEVTGITEEQISSAIGDEYTQLPAGIKRPEKWAESAEK